MTVLTVQMCLTVTHMICSTCLRKSYVLQFGNRGTIRFLRHCQAYCSGMSLRAFSRL